MFHEIESDGFAPFELLDERDTIEDLAIEIPAVHHGEGAVVEEFKVAYEREGVVATYVAKVGAWAAQQLERYVIPLEAGVVVCIDAAPRLEPETLLEREFRVVVGCDSLCCRIV